MQKKLSEITKTEWVSYWWIEIEPVMGDSSDDRDFMTAGKRTPDEAAQAMMDWDETAEFLEEPEE